MSGEQRPEENIFGPIGEPISPFWWEKHIDPAHWQEANRRHEGMHALVAEGVGSAVSRVHSRLGFGQANMHSWGYVACDGPEEIPRQLISVIALAGMPGGVVYLKDQGYDDQELLAALQHYSGGSDLDSVLQQLGAGEPIDPHRAEVDAIDLARNPHVQDAVGSIAEALADRGESMDRADLLAAIPRDFELPQLWTPEPSDHARLVRENADRIRELNVERERNGEEPYPVPEPPELPIPEQPVSSEPAHSDEPVPKNRGEEAHMAEIPHGDGDEYEEDLNFWDDKEIMESKYVGDTQYTRGYVRGTDYEEVWATRPSGTTEAITGGDDGLPAKTYWQTLTDPDAPTELGTQLQAEEELRNQVPSWLDREVEIDRLLQEHPDQLDMAREELEEGLLGQAGYEARIAELETFKQELEDEQATYEMERGETAAQEPVLQQYEEELATDGLTADELGANDFQATPTQDGVDEALDSAQRLRELVEGQQATGRDTEEQEVATSVEREPDRSIGPELDDPF